MTTSMQLVRNKDGSVYHIGELPDTHTFSALYVMSGGIPGAVADHAELMSQGADAGHINLDPMFDRDGNDIIFHFPEGDVRYKFVGFETDAAGQPMAGNWMYEKVG